MKKKMILKSLKKTSANTKKKISKKNIKKASGRTSVKKPQAVSEKPAFRPKPSDVAHSPGHRKLNKMNIFSEPKGPKVHLQEAAVNNMSNSDIIRKHNSRHRRIISGAAIGKTGRIIIKE